MKNRIEIPPLLLRGVIIDAVGILRIMRDELNQDPESNTEKLQRISKRLQYLEAYNALVDLHC